MGNSWSPSLPDAETLAQAAAALAGEAFSMLPMLEILESQM